MAKKSANATTAAQKLKKGAKKLLGTAKKSGKLAAALPLAALVVEEARAAQIETLPNFDLAGLDPFAQPEQPQELVLEEVMPEELAKAADEEVQELLAELDGESRSDDLLLAQAETNDRAAGYIASDAGGAGASASTASTAEAAAEGFELSGLPAAAVAGGPAGVFAAVATTAVVSVNNGGGTTPEARNDVDVSGSTTLSTSLETLQADGVDAVNATEGKLHLNVGDASKLLPTTAFPLFGDGDKDGVLTKAEDDALDVVLDVTDQDQLDQLLGFAGLNNLAAAGIDHLHLADGVSLIDAQAKAMSAAGLAFVNRDNVTLLASGENPSTVGAQGTKLGHEVSSLAAMGVDKIDMQGQGTGSVFITEAQAADLKEAGITFADDDAVTVVAQGTQLSGSLATINAWSELGVDRIDMANSAASFGEMHLSQAEFTALNAANISFVDTDTVTLMAQGTHMSASVTDMQNLGVDVIDFQTSSTVYITQAQADALNAAEIVFATGDHVVVDAHGTHVSSSLSSLHNDGVDAANHVEVSAFNVGASVDSTLSSEGVEYPNAKFADSAVFDAISGAFDVADFTSAVAGATVLKDALVADLHAEGYSDVVSGESVIVDAGSSDTLHTSLKTMGEMGVEGVASDASKVYVELGDDVNVATLVDTFGSTHDLFEQGQDASLVLGEATFSAMSEAEISNLIATISDLGFTEVSVLNAQGGNAYAIDNVAQTLVTTQVEILGADQAQALLDVFGTDILNNKNA
jgi:hypothetical protein